MGDRALVIFKVHRGLEAQVSPTIYLHNNGGNVPNYIEELEALMGDRVGDVDYATARLIGIIHGHMHGNLSLGVFNTPGHVNLAIKVGDDNSEDVLADYSHGDAGVVVVDAKDFSWRAYGGYLQQEHTAAQKGTW